MFCLKRNELRLAYTPQGFCLLENQASPTVDFAISAGIERNGLLDVDFDLVHATVEQRPQDGSALGTANERGDVAIRGCRFFGDLFAVHVVDGIGWLGLEVGEVNLAVLERD